MRTRFLIIALSAALSGAAWAQVAPPPKPNPIPPTTEPPPPAKDRSTGPRPGSLPATPPPTRETPTTTGPAVVQPGTPQTDLGHFYKISSLPGMSVALGSESLGKVTEAIINDGGCVQYLVVQTGPDAYVAVPWGVATVDFTKSAVTVRGAPGLTAEKIRSGAFARDNWPTFTDPVWSQRTTTMWGISTPRVAPRTGEPGTGAGSRTGTPRTASPGGAAVGPTPGSTPAAGTPPPSSGSTPPRPGTPGATPGGTTPGAGTTPKGTGGNPPPTLPGKGTGTGPGGPGR